MPQLLAPCLWFDDKAVEAAKFYVSVFPNSKLGRIARYGDAAAAAAGRPKGSVLTVEFTLDGQDFLALNGGPVFKFSEAVSFIVRCETQDEIDRYWEKLSADPKAEMCGWLKDRYGVSWQIVPAALAGMVADPDPARSERVMAALLKMKKLDLAALRRAHDGR